MKALIRASLCGVGLLVGLIAAAPAQEPPATATAADWPDLLQQRVELVTRLQEIQLAFQQIRQGQRQAEPDEVQKLQAEGNQIIQTLQTEVLPRMYAAAGELLKQDELSPENADLIAELAFRSFQQNQFADAARLADAVLAKVPANARAVNVAGVSRFALHDFEASATLLEQARDDGLLIPEFGGQYVDAARKYVDYWQQEQAVRAKEAAAEGDQQLPRVALKTSRGEVLLELFENEAPNTVANFISLVESGFYDGTKFHRVIPAFMAQGGDPNTKPGAEGQAGTGGPGYTIKCECDRPDARRHFAGSLSMAHTEDKDTGGSQFFITHLPTYHLDAGLAPAPHTVFGRVVEGMDVVLALKIGDAIESASVVRKRNHDYKPETQPDQP